MAGLSIGVTSRYPFAREFCKDYLSDETLKFDFSVSASEEEIEREYSFCDEETTREYTETVCIFRNIAEKLPIYNRCVFHGAAITYKGEAYLFTAPSGTGKTTHISLWKRYLGENVDIINGDKPVLEMGDDGVVVWSTPWAGKEGWQKNTKAPLKAVCMIGRGKVNSVRLLDPAEMIIRLLGQIYMPKNKGSAEKNLEIFSKFCEKTKFFELKCDISENAVKTSFEALTGNNFSEEKIK